VNPVVENEIIKMTEEFNIYDPMKEGDVYYVISIRWWKDWMLYVGRGVRDVSFGSNPGSIDNSDIVLGLMSNDCDTEPKLRDGLRNDIDYKLLHKEVWSVLYKWYGGGPIIARKVIAVGPFPKQLIVELYPLSLQLVVAPGENQLTLSMSKKDTLGELYRKVCVQFKLRSEQIRIWNFKGRTRRNLLVYCEDQTLEEAKIEMGQEILLEVDRKSSCDSPDTMNLGGEIDMPVWMRNTVVKRHSLFPCQETGTPLSRLWPPVKRCRSSVVQENNTATLPTSSQRARNADKYNSSLPMGLDNFVELKGSENPGITCNTKSALQHGDDSSCLPMKLLGLKGFKNLGNTCYMNSALQCVLHIPELVEFFLGDYKEHINHDNPLGYKGMLASAFGDLLREAWSPGKAFAPHSFKQTFGVLKPHFAGYSQEDAQEFLNVLLDGLHEEFNRVRSKSYTQIDDDNKCSDEELADKHHAVQKAMGDSIIQDLFVGQTRETLSCTTCGKVTRKFDSFNHLLVTFPKTIKTRVTVFSTDGIKRPAQHTITVNEEGTYQDIVNALNSLCSVRDDEKLLFAEISNGQILRYLDKPSDPFSNTADNVVLAAYRLPVVQDKLPLLVLQHQNQNGEGGELAPLIACLGHRTRTGADVQAVVYTLLAPMLRTQIKDKEDGHAALQCIETNISTEERSSFVLYLADENGNKTDTIIKEDEPIPFLDSRERLQVIVEWTEEKLKKYETDCLSNLPIAKRESEIQIRDKDLNLYTMLESVFKEKALSLDNFWFCPQCKEPRQAIQKRDIWRLPEILIVFLLRFHNEGFRTYAIKTFVDFPLDGFDLSKFVGNMNHTKGHIYKLFAITNHIGGLRGGHYTACVNLRNRWHNFNDDCVSSINEEDIKTAKAYLLFYRRVKTEDNVTCGK